MRQIIHIITPGDHFSPSTGSAIPTIVHNLSSAANKFGCESSVVIDKSTRKERYSSAAIVECQYRSFKLHKYQKIYDMVEGRITGIRHGVAKLYFPAIRAISETERANVIIHNAVPHPSLLKHVAPQHSYYTWLNNDVIQYYSLKERNSLVSSYDGIICCSEYIRKVTLSGVADKFQDRVHVVQNGVGLEQFKSHTALSSPKLTILYLGRVVPEKGVHVLVDAVHDLNDMGYDFCVRIVGRCGFDNNDALSQYERDLRQAANSSSNIEFLPFARRDEVPVIMANADILVVPSVWPDPNPLVVKEGLAAGLAVVCSDIGGIPEILQDGKWLFPPGDSKALAVKLSKLLDNADVTRGLGRDNRVYVQSFSWEHQFERLTQVLR